MLANILIVDDSYSSQITLKIALMRRGFECDICGNAKDAIKKFQANSYPIVICDVKMDDINGLQLASTLKKKAPETKIIFISAFSSRDELDSTDYEAFFEKPVDIEELCSALEQPVVSA